MKPAFLLLLGLLTAIFSCRKEVAPASADPLYRRWQAIESRETGGSWQAVTTTGSLEFRPDGQIRYESYPTPPCCVPLRVERNEDRLRGTEYSNEGRCALINCALLREMRILQISDNSLILQHDYENRLMEVRYRAL